jgi:hypothetical protein
MTHRGSGRSPRSYGESGEVALRALLVLVSLVLAAGAIAAAFLVGARFERDASKPLVERVQAIKQERDALMARVAELEQQNIVLDRSHQIDHEACRSLSEELKTAQDKRLGAEKEASLLRRLMQENGGGILEIKDLTLKKAAELGQFTYNFTVSQLVQDFGESDGDVRMEIIGKRNGKKTVLPLAELKGSKPPKHEMKLKHFQNFDGQIRLPDGFEPENLVVEIKPRTDGLVPVSETFPWHPE